jgi:hypothetical protein
MENVEQEQKPRQSRAEIFFTAMFLYALGLMVSGTVLGKFWYWFIASPFNLPLLPLAQCVGLMMLIGFVAPGGPTKVDTKTVTTGMLWDRFGARIWHCMMALGCGWVAYQFI